MLLLARGGATRGAKGLAGEGFKRPANARVHFKQPKTEVEEQAGKAKEQQKQQTKSKPWQQHGRQSEDDTA